MGLFDSNTKKVEKLILNNLGIGKNAFATCKENLKSCKNYHEFKSNVISHTVIAKATDTNWLMNKGYFLFEPGGVIDLLNKSLLSSSKGRFSIATKAIQQAVMKHRSDEQDFEVDEYSVPLNALMTYTKKERGFFKKRLMSEIDVLKMFVAYYIAWQLENIYEANKAKILEKTGAGEKVLPPLPTAPKPQAPKRAKPPVPTAPKPKKPLSAYPNDPPPFPPRKSKPNTPEDDFSDVPPPPVPRNPKRTGDEEDADSKKWRTQARNMILNMGTSKAIQRYEIYTANLPKHKQSEANAPTETLKKTARQNRISTEESIACIEEIFKSETDEYKSKIEKLNERDKLEEEKGKIEKEQKTVGEDKGKYHELLKLKLEAIDQKLKELPPPLPPEILAEQMNPTSDNPPATTPRNPVKPPKEKKHENDPRRVKKSPGRAKLSPDPRNKPTDEGSTPTPPEKTGPMDIGDKKSETTESEMPRKSISADALKEQAVKLKKAAPKPDKKRAQTMSAAELRRQAMGYDDDDDDDDDDMDFENGEFVKKKVASKKTEEKTPQPPAPEREPAYEPTEEDKKKRRETIAGIGLDSAKKLRSVKGAPKSRTSETPGTSFTDRLSEQINKANRKNPQK